MFAQTGVADAVILIVDDQAHNVRILREAVHDLGEVFFATNGQDAIAMAHQCRPDVVLLDIELGVMDGYEVCALFKRDPLLRDAAIIFVTSHTQAEFELQALEHGALDFLQKPLNVPVARARIKTHVALRSESKKLLAAQRDLEELLEHLPVLVASWSQDLRCLFCNDANGSWFARPAREMPGLELSDILDPAYLQALQPCIKSVLEGQAVDCEIEVQRLSDDCRYSHVVLIPRQINQVHSGFLMLLTDITDRKMAEVKRLEFMTSHDSLTHLPNRRMLQQRIALALRAVQLRDQQVGMLVVDIDQFKFVNDATGHAVGDNLLQVLARRMQQVCSEGQTVSRQSGDEYVLLVPGLVNVRDLADFAERIQGVIHEPIWIEGVSYELTASIGISVYPDDGDDGDSLYSHAEAAMYQAKQDGRNRYRFFSSDLESSTRSRLLLIRQMREALATGAFEVHYQAKVDVLHEWIVGVEALVRWPDAPGGPLSPAVFIPLAEETRLIIPLGHFVLRQACLQGRVWQDRGHGVVVSVNVSAVQFQDGSFQQQVRDILAESGLRPAALELEITEGVLIQDVGSGLATLNALKALGVRISIDDFGTGYSSMSYLKRLPIDVLKIDQSFVRDMLSTTADAAIVEAIISIGKALNLEMIAEGVETPEQARALLVRGCPIMQGYLYSRPVPAMHMSALLEQGAETLLTSTLGARP
jgi:diguanylate cyclase (GGDEF)-like protein/PAS domain S-box-containing protein